MRTRRAVAAAAVPILLLAACDGADEPPPDTEATDDEPADADDEEALEPAEVEPAQVTLLDAGEPPREPLRTDLAEGAEVTGSLGFEEEILADAAEDGQGPPQSGVIEVRLTVTDVEDGRATIAFAFEEVAIDGQDAGDTPLEGVEGTLVLDDRNRLLATTPTAQGIDQLPVPLPEEEVGRGAVWEVRIDDVFDLPATQVTTVELTGRDGDEYELELSVVTEGPGEPTPMPGTGREPGAELTLDELQRDGEGGQRASVSEPFPIRSTLTTETLLVVSLADEADDRDEELGPELGGEQRQELREQVVFERH